jgi:predicted nucleic acid-binding protein
VDRVFLDANVLFSASHREHSRVLWLWERSDVRLLTSDYAIEEARRNLTTADSHERFARLILALEIVPISAASSPNTRFSEIDLPEKDQPILTSAINARATHLLTGDKKHFSRYFGQRIRGVLIQTPAQYGLSTSTND